MLSSRHHYVFEPLQVGVTCHETLVRMSHATHTSPAVYGLGAGAALAEQGTELLRRKRFVEQGHRRAHQKRLHGRGEGIPF